MSVRRVARRRPARGLLLLLAGCLVLSGCTGEPDVPPVTYSTLGVPGEMVCGFVPKADIVTAIGNSAFDSQGTLQGRGGSRPLQESNCVVFPKGNRAAKSFEVVVWDRALDEGTTEYDLKHPLPTYVLFPGDNPIGFAERAYEYVDSKGTRKSGAVAVAIVGDWYINLRIFRPGPGRDAIKDSIDLVQRVVASLQLPPQATKTYAPWVPSTPPPSSPSSTPTR
jgi:hypothetical protein